MPEEIKAIVRVPFHSEHIEASHDLTTGIWVSIRRVCEHIGLGYAPQYTKLKKSPWAVVTMIITTGPDGKNYETFCIRADCVAKWMSEINPNKVRPELRAMIEAYQVEARQVLSAYFTPEASEAAGEPSLRDFVVRQEQIEARQEKDRKYWLERDTRTTEIINRQGDKILELEKIVDSIRSSEPIGVVEARRILDRIKVLASKRLDLEPALEPTVPFERRRRFMQIRRQEEDELRRLMPYPRDTGNSFSNLPSDKMGKLRQELHTREEELRRQTARRRREHSRKGQGGLFGDGNLN